MTGFKMTKEEVIQLFKSGDFTIIYWDNQEPTIYKGKWDLHEESENDDYFRLNQNEIKINESYMTGYCPDIVEWLAQALGGKTDSI